MNDSRTPAVDTMVAVEGVGKSFGGTTAVTDVTFSVPRGRFLTILGPSGSGKTTLLRMIAGFIEPSQGEIYIHGKPVSAVPPHRRAIGMVFQRLALFPHLTAWDNVAYPLRMRGFDAAEIPDRVAAMFGIVQLKGFEQRRIQQLSGGQQQRVAIARALVFEPDLVLLDEPLAALDRKLREEMQLEFRRIQQELGVTTINVTHDQREALVMSDEVMVMDGGRVQQLAPPAETYRNPANAFVATFIGVTNFLPAHVASRTGSALRVRIGDLESPARLADPQLPTPPHGAAVDCALRAEHVWLRSGAPADADCSSSGRVMQCIFEGDRIVYEVAVAALGPALIRVIDRTPEAHLLLAPGAPVEVGWNARDLIVFPR
ncbi:MAG: ABC transporter ATP-binding protein [Burkholderiales bacterium]|nr:ABC transporter ATP-binding protein [Burkholderiales bacterium]